MSIFTSLLAAACAVGGSANGADLRVGRAWCEGPAERPDPRVRTYVAPMRVLWTGVEAGPSGRVERTELFLPRAGFVPDVRTPPAFLVQAQDDVCRVESALTHYVQLKYAGVPAELHLFASGGHGYNLVAKKTTGVEQWPKLAENWLKRLKR